MPRRHAGRDRLELSGQSSPRGYSSFLRWGKALLLAVPWCAGVSRPSARGE